MIGIKSLFRATSNLIIRRKQINNFANLSFREITKSDFDAVMSIRKPEEIYNGRDYLGDYYMMLLQTPGYKGYATFADGKMVNSIFVVVVDDGKTLVVLASRTSKEYCRHGILKSVSCHAMGEHCKVYPNLLYFAGVCDKEMYYDLVYPNVKRGHQKLVDKKDISACKIESHNMWEHLRKHESPSGIEEISHQDLENLFQMKSLQEIFPNKRILTNWIPYECFKSNIPYICNQRCTMFGTNVKRYINAEQSLLTFGHHSRFPNSLYYGIDVYGQNINVLPEHIIAHLKNFKKPSHSEVTLAISYHDNLLNKSLCDMITEKLGFESSYEEQQYCTIGYIRDLCNKN